MASPVGQTSSADPSPKPALRPDRPCDTCRRRKSRCVISSTDSTTCVLCQFHQQACTFVEDAAPRKRKQVVGGSADEDGGGRGKRINSGDQIPTLYADGSVRDGAVIDDYANLQGESLLKKTLGLQSQRHAKYIGPTDNHDALLLDLDLQFLDNAGNNDHASTSGYGFNTIRKVAPNEFFQQFPDSSQPTHAREIEDLDRIESLVAPHGSALIKLYFRTVHPSFPILHKKVYLEKYARSHREFSPPLLAAVYLLALNWWSYSPELAANPKPDVRELEAIAHRALQDVSQRAKLSTVQAGLLLLQRSNIGAPRNIPPNTASTTNNGGSNTIANTWPLTAQLVAVGQDLGLHRDCSRWRIPGWERGLRKRLGWALFMQDAWGALVHGRPPHIAYGGPQASNSASGTGSSSSSSDGGWIGGSNWAVPPVTGADFPESAADEDSAEGSTEVEAGRALFAAMISLSQILARAMDALFSAAAEAQIDAAPDPTRAVLARAKSIQLLLRAFYADLPDALRLEASPRVGKLSSVGGLHVAYFAVEIALHRRVLRTLGPRTDPLLVQVCRSAARERLVGAMDAVGRLRPEHLQGFWYFASGFNVALVGVFAGLCLVTAAGREEAEFYAGRLREFRWRVRVARGSAGFLEEAGRRLEGAVGGLLRVVDGGEGMAGRLAFLWRGAEQEEPEGEEEGQEKEDEREDLMDAFFTGPQETIPYDFSLGVEDGVPSVLL